MPWKAKPYVKLICMVNVPLFSYFEIKNLTFVLFVVNFCNNSGLSVNNTSKNLRLITTNQIVEQIDAIIVIKDD